METNWVLDSFHIENGLSTERVLRFVTVILSVLRFKPKSAVEKKREFSRLLTVLSTIE